MRELKFRGYNKRKNEIVEVFGITPDSIMCQYRDKIFLDLRESVEQITQYIGIKDKYGTKIYEGDFIRVGNSIKMLVCFGNTIHKVVSKYNGQIKEITMTGFYFKDMEGKEVLAQTNLISKEIEIIGNIYENPELMEGFNV